MARIATIANETATQCRLFRKNTENRYVRRIDEIAAMVYLNRSNVLSDFPILVASVETRRAS